jgi:thioredoxin-related protein
MKTVTIFLSGIFLAALVFANTPERKSETKKDTGIAFHKGTWNEALQLAKKEGKPIFLDISASWCGPCKMLKSKTFPDSEVGEFYNANFINVAVDGEKGEGVDLAGKYKIKGYPSLIYIDKNGQLIAQTAGYRNPKQLIDLGKQIIQK